MRLSEFIQANGAAILEDWLAALRREAPAQARALDRPALIDHMPRVLADLAEVMKTRDEQPALVEIADEHADEHAVERIDQGFLVSNVVREFAVLRSSILRLWRASFASAMSVDDVELLTRVVDRAVERSVDRYFERRAQLLEGFEQIADAAFNTEDLGAFLDRLLRIFMRFAPSVDSAAVLLREGDRLFVRAAVGLDEEVRAGTNVSIGQGFAGTIAETRRPLLVRDAWNDPLVPSSIIRERKTRALYGVPLTDREDVVGVAHVGTSAADDLPVAEKRLFAALAQRATSAIVKHSLRAQARRALAELDAVAEAIPSPVYVGDGERLTFANAAGLRLLGLTSREQLTSGIRALASPIDARDASTGKTLELDEMPYFRALREGEQTTREIRLKDPTTGEDRVLRAHAGPIRDRGRVFGAVAVLTDLTELASAANQLRLLVDNIPELCWMALPDGHIDFYNRRWFDYTGTTLEEMRGWGWEKVHDPSVLPEVLERWKASIASGEPFEMEFPLRGADGAFRWFLTRIVPLRDAAGRIVRWFGTNTNIDEERRLRRELRKAFDDSKRAADFRERFIGIVSHDLRNPLGAIAMGTARMLEDPEFPEHLSTTAGRVLTNVDRMTRMISDLLDFTRGRLGGGIPIKPARVDLTNVAAQVIEEIEAAFPGRRVISETRGDAVGRWDRDRLAQLLSNLVSNAVTHGAPETPVRVELDGSRDGEVVVRVQNANAGNPIPPDLLERIFEPFRRGTDSGEWRHERDGLGLGLFIAREITRAHGGSIRVTSDAEGGTTFVVSLPRSPDDATSTRTHRDVHV